MASSYGYSLNNGSLIPINRVLKGKIKNYAYIKLRRNCLYLLCLHKAKEKLSFLQTTRHCHSLFFFFFFFFFGDNLIVGEEGFEPRYFYWIYNKLSVELPPNAKIQLKLTELSHTWHTRAPDPTRLTLPIFFFQNPELPLPLNQIWDKNKGLQTWRCVGGGDAEME